MDSMMRSRGAMFTIVVLFLLWCIVVLLLTIQDYKRENSEFRQTISLLREDNVRMDIAESDVEILTFNLARYLIPQFAKSSTGDEVSLKGLSWETQNMILNLTGLPSLPFEGNLVNLALSIPTIVDILPHLLEFSDTLIPHLHVASKPKRSVSMVLGIPNVQRESSSYLQLTLQSILSSITLEEELDTLVVVFIAETDLEYVLETAEEIKTNFPKQVASGLVEIISSPPNYYPDFQSMETTLKDSKGRFIWRSKAVLDYIFLMMYVYNRGKYFVQLEDDVITKLGFVTEMKSAADQRSANDKNWFVLSFCDLGFIGKLFRSSDLPFLIYYYAMFYKNQPVDWMLPNIMQSKMCALGLSHKECIALENQLWVQYRPSLFQHIGTQSSLHGKFQRLKDKHFTNVTLFWPHENPPALLNTSLQALKENYSLEQAYQGKNFFWAQKLSAGDHVTFNFQPPINISTFVFRSGNAEHIEDMFYDTTVEVLSSQHSVNDNYTTVGSFDIFGGANGKVDKTLWPVKSLRLLTHSDSQFWVILSEILIVNNSTLP